MLCGDDYYGKVDHVPGLFFVKTRFLHVWWFPLVPRDSHLILDDDSRRGVSIPLRWKSVWVAWARAVTLVVATYLLALGTSLPFLAPTPPSRRVLVAAALYGLALPFLGLYLLTSRSRRATLERALELGPLIGIPPELIKAHFQEDEWGWPVSDRMDEV